MCSGMPEAQFVFTRSLLTSLSNRVRTLGDRDGTWAAAALVLHTTHVSSPEEYQRPCGWNWLHIQ